MSQLSHFCHACGSSIDPRAEICPRCGVRQRASIATSSPNDYFLRDAAGKKLAAGLCGIFLGALGVHKFIFGATTAGVIMIAVSLVTCGLGTVPMAIIGLIEGIIYLTKSDADFYREYVVEKRAWF